MVFFRAVCEAFLRKVYRGARGVRSLALPNTFAFREKGPILWTSPVENFVLQRSDRTMQPVWPLFYAFIGWGLSKSSDQFSLVSGLRLARGRLIPCTEALLVAHPLQKRKCKNIPGTSFVRA